MIDPNGAVVCVTGGARGIGRATAALLAERGARVWIGDLDADAVAATAAELGVAGHPLDVTDPISFQSFLDAARADGPVDMLVNNAGIMRMGPFADQALAGHHREIAINLTGVVNGVHLALPAMTERGRGHIVNVASMAGKVTTPGIAVYCATKFAVVALSRAVRAELHGTGVTLTTILPAATRTELTAGVSLDLQPTLVPEDVAAAIVRSARHGRREVTVPRWLAPVGTLEQAFPEPAVESLKRVVTRHRPPGDYDADQRKAYLDRAGP
ncbi:SDR family oxidoreductase [Actinomadura sp. 7K507]|uniref:SDR family oxidoreductase n=1 Tax=Actinomadura sp. 7K507 TaxID=2530365 RepID=UPI00104CE517|nr:SDR family oxidoreductase [Actinomadura sp. 7K507]TDC81047.1 SDR family oxidoreductase [Actinomadura sp. 7K507]